MPRSGAGVYSLPAGTTATSNTLIESADYNTFLSDIQEDLNNPRPVVAGGTGASTASNARANLGLEIGSDVVGYSATLASFGALGTAANKLAYTTGADTWAETGLTSFARTLLDDTDAATARGTLGLGDAATYDVSTDTDFSADTGDITTRATTKTFVEARIDFFSLGRGQYWQDVTGSRSVNTVYQHTGVRPIMVAISGNSSSTATIQASTDGSTWVTVGSVSSGGVTITTIIVPAGHYYRVNGPATITEWAELRG